jgi:hypothetical protein
MTEEAQCAIGTTILRNGLALGEMHEPSMPDTTGDLNDTNSQNNVGGVKTTCVGWIGNGVLGFKLFYTGSTAQETLRAAIYDRAFDIWEVVMPMNFNDGKNGFTWSGQISKCSLMNDGSASPYLDMEVTVNGKITATSTASAGLTTGFFSIADDGANALAPSPAASGSVYEYTVEAYSDSLTVAITPTATAGTIRVNGVVVATGAASAAITLNTGTGAVTMIPITVKELNKTSKIYWLRFVIGTTAQP